MDSQSKNIKMEQDKSSALESLSSPSPTIPSISLDGPFNETRSPASSNSSNNSNGEYTRMPILVLVDENQVQNKMDQSLHEQNQDTLVNTEVGGHEIQSQTQGPGPEPSIKPNPKAKIKREKPDFNFTQDDLNMIDTSLPNVCNINNNNKSGPSSSGTMNMNTNVDSAGAVIIKQEKDASSFQVKANAVVDSFSNRIKEKFTTAISVDVTDQDIRKEIDKNNAKIQETVKIEAAVAAQSDQVIIPEKKAKKVNSEQQSNNDAEISMLNARPKRAASARKHIVNGIEFPAEEQPYRRKKKSTTEVKSSSTSSSAGTSIYEQFTAALNEPIASSSNGFPHVPRRISNRCSSKASEENNLSNGDHAQFMEIDNDDSELKAQKFSSSSDEISFAISYSEEDKKSLFKVGNFLINKKDAIYNPYDLDRESSTEDLDIYQIEEQQLRLFEGLLINNMVFHVSTEECILITSKDDLYRDYQPIYVKVIHIVKPADPSKPDHSYAKYFPVDRIGPVLGLIPKSERYIEMFATCLQTITIEVVSTGFMTRKIVQGQLPEEISKAWASIREALKVHYDELLEIIPWDKELLKLLDKFPLIKISTSVDDKRRFAGKLCYFCSSNKPGIKKLLVLYGKKYNKMDFSDVSDQKENDPIPACNDCHTSVEIYSRVYHHLFHVYLTMYNNIDNILEPLKFREAYRAQDLINYFINDKYFIQKMFLDFQVVLAECEKLTDDFYKLKEKQTKQENEANYAKLEELFKRDESLQLNVKPGPLKMKIKGVEKSINQMENNIQTEQLASNILPAPTPAEVMSQVDTTSIKMEIS